jgi:hypothetical protein
MDKTDDAARHRGAGGGGGGGGVNANQTAQLIALPDMNFRPEIFLSS